MLVLKTADNISELSVVEGASKLLSLHGESEVLYLTAEFAPFSNQQRPDLLFIRERAGKKEIFFIEYKMNIRKETIADLIKLLPEHREFVQDCIKGKLNYIFSTNVSLELQLINNLKGHKITAIDSIQNEVDLYDAILKIS